MALDGVALLLFNISQGRRLMRKRMMLLLAVGAVTLAGVVGYASLDSDIKRALSVAHSTKPDVLSWPVDQRDAFFRVLDRFPMLTKARDIQAGSTPLPLPVGAPLSIPGIERYMQEQRSAGLVILHDGKVRFERYGLGFSAQGRWTSFSVAKSFTSTLVGAALQDGAIKSLEDKVSTYIPGMRGSVYDDVTIRQLLMMSSGVAWNEDYEDPKSDVATLNQVKPAEGENATVATMRKLGRAHPPGQVWHYSTGETNLIGVVVSAATGKPLSHYLEEKIWQPVGMEANASWLLDSSGHEISGCCIQAATRDFARFGLFVLAGGRVGDKQIVPPDWFAQATTKQIDIGDPGHGYGYQWWTYDDGSVAAQGIFGQGIFIDAKRRLVIASNANWPRATIGPQKAQREAFYRQVQRLIDTEQTAPAP
jgi:CubicO group peptidase (beta-lactamase class C family)